MNTATNSTIAQFFKSEQFGAFLDGLQIETATCEQGHLQEGKWFAPTCGKITGIVCVGDDPHWFFSDEEIAEILFKGFCKTCSNPIKIAYYCGATIYWDCPLEEIL